MTITTEEAEWLAKQHDLVRFTLGMKAPEHDLTAATIRSLAAERDALQAGQDKARDYLSICLQVLHPTIELLPDLLGVCTQIDNVLAGQRAENARLRETLLLARIAVSHASELSDRILYTQDLAKIDAALGETQ